jgi:hypothetical protein
MMPFNRFVLIWSLVFVAALTGRNIRVCLVNEQQKYAVFGNVPVPSAL